MTEKSLTPQAEHPTKNSPLADSFAAVEENYKRITDDIAQAAYRSGRSESDIELVAVTKTVGVELINHAISLGVRHIGENRVQELSSKYNMLRRDGLKISVIGHLQTNKVKKALELSDMIQSVDSIRLGNEISARSVERGRITPCLVEINIGNEVTKTGVPFDMAEELVLQLSELDGIKVSGLMTIPPFDAESAQLRRYFEKIHKLYVDIASKNYHNSNIEMQYLSMGMSSDYVEAIEIGANMVRIGTALFGVRK